MSPEHLLHEARALPIDQRQQLICDLVGEMPALAMSRLVTRFEDVFGVKANKTSTIDPKLLELLQEKDRKVIETKPVEFDVVLSSCGDSKIKVIKEVRSITGMALREAKKLVDNAPTRIAGPHTEEEAENLKALLEGVGASILIEARED